jgi:predicted Zn-dependent protease
MLEAFVEWQLWARAPFAEIEPNLDRLCLLKPDDLNSRRIRARLRVQNGRPAEALADAQHILRLDPGDSNMRTLAAVAASEAGQYDLAVQELARVLEGSPRPETALMLIRNYLQLGQPAKAEGVLNQYFPNAEKHPEAFVLRGRILQVAGKHEAAIAVLRSAADTFADQREYALYWLAESQRALNRDADAVQTLGELDRFKARDRIVKDARQQPDSMAAQVRAAELLLADGKPAEAAALLEPATLRLGKTPVAAKLLAQAYRQLGRTDRAAEWERLATGK